MQHTDGACIGRAIVAYAGDNDTMCQRGRDSSPQFSDFGQFVWMGFLIGPQKN